MIKKIRMVGLISLIGLFSCDDSSSIKTCGDGVVDIEEDCDGENIGTSECEDFDYYGGTLKCNADCTFDFSDCQDAGYCGDGIIHENQEEECDADNLNDTLCENFGYYGGVLACDDNCKFDISECRFCGDGIIQEDEDEECDGENITTCQDLGFYQGTPTCTEDCKINSDQCSGVCGDNLINGTEQCDGTDIVDTCNEYNVWGCTLTCSGECVTEFSNGFNSLLLGCQDYDFSKSIAVDSNGNIIIAGVTTGTYQGLPVSIARDIFITKINPSGVILWSVIAGSEGDDAANSVAVDSQGNIYVAGSTTGEMPGCESEPVQETDGIILKYDTNGIFQACMKAGYGQNYRTGTESVTKVLTIPADPANSIPELVIGVYDTANNIGCLDNQNVEVMFWNTDGAYRFGPVIIGTGSYEASITAALDSSKNLYVGGITSGDFTGGTNTSTDGFVAKLSPGTVFYWYELVYVRQYGNSNEYETINSMAFNPAGHLIVAGNASGNAFGTPLGTGDVFIAHINTANGDMLNSRYLGSDFFEESPVIAINQNSDIYVFAKGNKLGSLTGPGSIDLWAVKLDVAWNTLDTRFIGTNQSEFISDAAFDATSSRIFITGGTDGTWDSISGLGGLDAFVTRLDY